MKTVARTLAKSLLGFSLCVLFPMGVWADVVDLAQSPLTKATVSEVRPNLMFILDDSGSMNWDYMPDLVVSSSSGSSYCKGSAATGTNYACCRTTGGTGPGTGAGATCLENTNLVSGVKRNTAGMPPFYASGFNKIYYDPTVTYAPPFDEGGTEKTNYNGTGNVPLDAYDVQTNSVLNLSTNYPDVEWCTNTTYTDCLRNGDYLLPGTVDGNSYTTMRVTTVSGMTARFAVGPVDAPRIESQALGPYYYVVLPGEYCADASLTDCVEASGPTASHPVPAALRWCKNADRTDCRATQSAVYNYPRYPTIVTGQSVDGKTSKTGNFGLDAVKQSNATGVNDACNGKTNVVTVSSVRVGSMEILSEPFKYCSANSNQTTRNGGLAQEIVARISNDFSAVHVPNRSLNITAPDGSFNGQSVDITMVGASLYQPNNMKFSGGVVAKDLEFVPGSFRRIDIVSGRTYGNIVNESGTVLLDRSYRSDCAARPNCTYAEELRNFANWFAWYRTRMQAMKTSVSRTFATIDSSYRVGFRTLNNNKNGNGNKEVNLKIDVFSSTHKANWYNSLFKAYPNSGTPLRRTLSDVGRIYAGKGSGASGTDPVQYSCQQNFALLTSDGYWNKSDASDHVGIDLYGNKVNNQDGSGTSRPYYEGPTASAGSLADVAKYYYETDLRTSDLGNCTGALAGENVCINNVFGSGEDTQTAQHMTTFTLGLGVDGELRYQSDYKTAKSGDYYNIRNGLGSPQANWPVPVGDTATAVDDMWHAAVNGRGTYFSAGNPKELADGLSKALREIEVKSGAGAAAATSTLAPVVGEDNHAYVASYQTVKWTGNLEARAIDATNGDVGTSALMCVENVVSGSGDSASVACSGTMGSLVDEDDDSRKILMASGDDLVDFSYENMSAGQKAYFNPATLSQWTELTADQQANATSENLVKYMRGQYGLEMRASNPPAQQVFRQRDAVLGDLVESTPNYVQKPNFSYTDPGFTEFKNDLSTRGGTIYVGANDGMLHAFNASNLKERWAYVPSMVMPGMKVLADKNYDKLHRYFVNGAPTVWDICISDCKDAEKAEWRSVLIGGLNGGGRGYYALDVTDPDDPALLWEFTTEDDDDLGYSFGEPVVTKLEDGQWVAVLSSGYNNIDGSNKGEGFLYVLDVWTGAKVRKIGTGAGSAANPSGLARFAVWADDQTRDNTAGYTYGGDLHGNVWRFDINEGESSANPVKFATLYSDDEGSKPQPITTRPTLGKYNDKRMIFIGTGKYLGSSDLTDFEVQSLYGIRDNDETETLDNARNFLVEQTLVVDSEDDSKRVSGSDNLVPSDKRGWFIDLPDKGERQNVPSELVRGVLIVPTTVPTATACEPDGYSWLSFIDYRTGKQVPGWDWVSTRLDAPIVGINITYIGDEPVVSVVTADNPTPKRINPPGKFPGKDVGFQKKRAVWREVIDD